MQRAEPGTGPVSYTHLDVYKRQEQGLHVPEKGKTFAGEVREETVAWSKDTYQLLKQAEQGKVKSYVQDIACLLYTSRCV